jgi:Cu/Zn superoxide dismutase
MTKSWMVAVAFAALSAGGCSMMQATPSMPTFTATLAPGAGVTSSGKGSGTFTYDPAAHTLTYNVTYEGLTGPASAAHIHGPADPGANAGVVVPFATATSPIAGTATLTDAQAAELMAGKYYVNVHTAANRGGEIRGQIMPKAGR